jgi:hypothetical protein
MFSLQISSRIGACSVLRADGQVSGDTASGRRPLLWAWGLRPLAGALPATVPAVAADARLASRLADFTVVGTGSQLQLAAGVLPAGVYDVALVTRNWLGNISAVTVQRVRQTPRVKFSVSCWR